MSAQACEHCGLPLNVNLNSRSVHVCPNNPEMAAIWLGGSEGPLSDKQTHGLYQEDIVEGIRCGQCQYLASISRQDYKRVVTAAHGVEPKQ